jgi:hypothetical protein
MCRRRQINRAIALLACAGLLALLAGGADAALIKVKDLVLKADGGFFPSKLSRNSFEPINFRGHASLSNSQGGAPAELQEMRLDFSRDGLLETRGLPVCPVSSIEHADTGQARRICAGALIGTGHVGAIFDFAGIGIEAKVKASLFNGPPKGGNPTVIGHAYTTIPYPRTYTVVIPIIRLRNGPFAYRATFEIPKLAAGGILTHIDGRIGRRYDYHGSERSYVNARCPTGVIRTHGHFLFADGTIMDGTLETPCTPVPLVRVP